MKQNNDNSIEEEKYDSAQNEYEYDGIEYEWSDIQNVNILESNEKQLFAIPPQTLKCEYVSQQTDEENDSSTSLSSNSFKYISINAPYTIVNSLPFNMRIYFDIIKSVEERTIVNQNPSIAELMQCTEEVTEPNPHSLSNTRLTSSRANLKKELGSIQENEEEDSSNNSNGEYQDAISFQRNIPKKFEYIDIEK